MLTHVAFEDAAGFAAPIAAAGYAIGTVDRPERVDWREAGLVVVMGGPMGVHEQAAHPRLAAEMDGLRARIAIGAPTLGICLGAQLAAAALGAAVRPAAAMEVGFAPVRLLPAGRASPLRHLADVPVLHWHGDMFELPDGVEPLAETDRCPNQAFRLGRHLLALQFHPEMGEPGGLAPWLAGADDHLAAAGTDAATLTRDEAALGPAAVAAGRRMLTEWLDGLDA